MSVGEHALDLAPVEIRREFQRRGVYWASDGRPVQRACGIIADRRARLLTLAAPMAETSGLSECTHARPGWELKHDDAGVELAVRGDWIARESGARSRAEVEALVVQVSADVTQLRISSRELGLWDS